MELKVHISGELSVLIVGKIQLPINKNGSRLCHNSGQAGLSQELLFVRKTKPNFCSLLNMKNEEKPR